MKIDLSNSEFTVFLDNQRRTTAELVQSKVDVQQTENRRADWERKFRDLDAKRSDALINAEDKVASLQGELDALKIKLERVTKAFTPEMVGQWQAHDEAQKRLTIHDWTLLCRSNPKEATTQLQAAFMNGAAPQMSTDKAANAISQFVYYLPTLK